MTRVAILTDNDFDRANSVTTTLKAVLRHAPPDVMPRVYTTSDAAIETHEYLSLPSFGISLPWYSEMRVYCPRLLALARHLRHDHAHLLHLSTPGPMGLAAKWLAYRSGLPMTASYRATSGASLARLSGRRWLSDRMEQYTRWVYAGCRPVLVPSLLAANGLRAWGYPADRLQLWPHGVDTEMFSPAHRSGGWRDAWRVDDRRPAIVYAGRLSREKSVALLPDVMNRLYRLRVPHRLIIVGDGPMAGELRGWCPDAVFLGCLPHHEVAVALASADIFLFPSESAAAGTVVLEAQASGVPVVVSDRGGSQEYIRNGLTGRVAASGNVEVFAQHLAAYLANADIRREAGRQGRELAMRYSWPAALQPLWQAWRTAAGQHARLAWRTDGPPAGALGRTA